MQIYIPDLVADYEIDRVGNTIFLKKITVLGVVINDPVIFAKASKQIIDFHWRNGDFGTVPKEPLENEGTDWEGYARQGNESNLE